jgi:signal transduction histidine kinase
MKRMSEGVAVWLFVSSLIVLGLLAIAADKAAARYGSSADWVAHTKDVETEVGRVRMKAAQAEADVLEYLDSGDTERLERFRADAKEAEGHVVNLRKLTVDNAAQQTRLDRLEAGLKETITGLERLATLGNATNSRLTGDASRQEATVRAHIDEVDGDLQGMRAEEQNLLVTRVQASTIAYRDVRLLFAASLIIVAVLLGLSFQSIVAQVRERRQAEAAVRKLSARLLTTQDVERRRVARELHDSVGQIFASLGMTLGPKAHDVSLSAPVKRAMDDALQLVQEGVKETRTISHLLHPPLLEELGFEAAAKWYIEGFAKRSHIEVELHAPETNRRLPEGMELLLFRALQESLTNVHRHSGSQRVDVSLVSDAKAVTLRVKDYGKGISAELLETLRASPASTGVGLGGLRERVREFDGKMEIESDASGTVLTIELPLPGERTAEQSAGPAAPVLDAELRRAKDVTPGEGMQFAGATS